MADLCALEAHDIAARLETLPRWSMQDGSLHRMFRTQGWKGALMVVNAIGHLAEAAWHHPELKVSWGRVEVALSTHEVGGISARDFELARKIDDMIGWRPARDGGSLEGGPADPQFAYILYDD